MAFAFSHPHPTFLEFVPLDGLGLHADYHAHERQRQRQLALKQVEEAERRRRLAQEYEAAAYRAAYAFMAREQRRREEERRRLFEARRARQRQVHMPTQLLELLFPLDATSNLFAVDDKDSGASADEQDVEQEVVHLVPLGAPAFDSPDSNDVNLDETASDSASTVLGADNEDLSDTETVTSSASNYRDTALSTLEGLAAEFDARRAAFVAPPTLTFSPSPSPVDRTARSPTPPLAFGTSNAGFLGYEEALLALLTRIDAVESHGDRDVQRARKELVREVERELGRLDAMKERAWEEQSGSSAGDNETADESMDGSEEEDASMDEDEVDVLTLSSEPDSDSDLSPSDSDLHSAEPVKIPFRAPQAARRTRFASRSPSPPSDEPSDDDDDDVEDDTPIVAAEVDSRLGETRRERRAQAEREAWRGESDDDDEELSSDEDGVWVYC